LSRGGFTPLNSFAELKSLVSIEEVARALRIPLKHGYQNCPFCGGGGSFRVTSQNFHCFHPRCLASGDVFNLLVKLEVCRSSTEALKLISKTFNLSLDYKDWIQRTKTLSQAFEVYKGHFKRDKLPREILASRGLIEVCHTQSIGYAPSGTPLLDAGLSKDDLAAAKLLTARGYELLQNRIIFPIYTLNREVAHFQGRSCDPSDDLRWLSTPSSSGVQSISQYFYNSPALTTKLDTLFVAEGITDALSLIELGFPAIGILGVNMSLAKEADRLGSVSRIIVFLDNDSYSKLNDSTFGRYKSWLSMTPKLLELQEERPDLEIYCLMPPSEVENDVNTWLQLGLTKDALLRYVQSSAKMLTEFILDLYLEDPEYHCWCLEAVIRDFERGKLDATTAHKFEMKTNEIISRGGLLRYLCSMYLSRQQLR